MTVPTLDSTAAAEYFFAGATNAGLAHVVLSPGSRSTPLSIAAWRTPGLSTSIELDERVAAFVALGRAKVSGRPVGLVCTSGTAAANYLPAIAEASMSNIPLVIITADRPPEHQAWGVGQSFDQRGLYQRQVRTEMTMPVGGDAGPAHAQRAGWRATATAIEQHGPVHVNWAFRMPLEPTTTAIDPPPPLSNVRVPVHEADSQHVDELSGLLTRARRPLIIAGPDTNPATSTGHQASDSATMRFAADHGIPVLADVLNGLPAGPDDPVIAGHAVLTDSPATPAPDLIIHLGQTPTAKALRLWWEQLDCVHVLLDPFDEWQDPSHMVGVRLRCSPESAFAKLASAELPTDPSWLERWVELGINVRAATQDLLNGWPTTTEAHIARSVASAATPADRIVASSSMPVRDLDTFSMTPSVRVLANRGINGIDGVISTAAGIHEASTVGRTFVLIGDVAALHDVGGILAAARNGSNLTVVVPNNDGGGIFSFLPVKDSIDEPLFQELFHTPHGTNFDFLSSHRNVHHEHSSDLDASLVSAAKRSGVSIIEVAVDTSDRLALQAALTNAVKGVRP